MHVIHSPIYFASDPGITHCQKIQIVGSEEPLTSELLHKSKIKKELDIFGDEWIIDICVPYEGSSEVLETKVSACMRNKIALKDTEARHAFYSSYEYIINMKILLNTS